MAANHDDLVLALPGLQVFYPLDETSGTDVADAQGGFDGTYVGSPTLGAAGFLDGVANGGNAVTFNGSNRIELPTSLNDLILGLIDGLTLAWYASSTDTTGQRAFFHGFDTGTVNGFGVMPNTSFNGSTFSSNSGRLTIVLRDAAGNSAWKTFNRDSGGAGFQDMMWNDGQPHFYVAQFRRVAGAGNSVVRLWIDGIELTSPVTSGSAALNAMLSGITGPFCIGATSVGGTVTNALSATMSRFMIAGGLRTPAEMLDIYRAGPYSFGKLAHVRMHFDLTDPAHIFTDENGTTNVVAGVGARVRRINCKAGSGYYLQGESSGSPTRNDDSVPWWNGREVIVDNTLCKTGAAGGSPKQGVGLTLKQSAVIPFKFIRGTMLAVASPIGNYINNASTPRFLMLFRSGTNWLGLATGPTEAQDQVSSVNANERILATCTSVFRRVNIANAALPPILTRPHFSIFGWTAGQRGNMPGNADGTDMKFFVDGQSANLASGVTIGAGAWGNAHDGGGVMGATLTEANAVSGGDAQSFVGKHLLVLNRPITDQEIADSYADLRSQMTNDERGGTLGTMVILGSSTSAQQKSSNLTGWQTRLGADLLAIFQIRAMARGFRRLSEAKHIATGSFFWTGRPLKNRVAVVYLGINDITQGAPANNGAADTLAATMYADLQTTVTNLRSGGATKVIVGLVPEHIFSSFNLRAAQGFNTLVLANNPGDGPPWQPPAYANDDGIHPNDFGHDQVADSFTDYSRRYVTEGFSTGLIRNSRTTRTYRVERDW